MIVPMKKISLILLEKEKESALKTLRKLGLLHIEIEQGSGEKLRQLEEEIALLEKAIYLLGKQKKKKKSYPTLTSEEALQKAEEIVALTDSIKDLREQNALLLAEQAKWADWGEFDPASLQELKDTGLPLTVCEMPADGYKTLDIPTVALKKNKSTVRFVALGEREELERYRVKFPVTSPAHRKKAVEDNEKAMAAAEKVLSGYGDYATTLNDAIAARNKAVEFETYATGMETETLAEGEKAPTVAYFRGYAEADKADLIVQTAKEKAWGIVVEDPTPEDNVPTKLKNNKFVSLIYPMTDFLGTVPGYFEFDISGWFLTFILVFFGIIFGDGGYGLLITGGAAALMGWNLIRKKPIPPAYLLAGLLGLSTVAWGFLTCTWFGIEATTLPKWLQTLSWAPISNVYADKLWCPFWTNGEAGLTTAQNVQIFCFTLALIQLVVAHIMCAVRNRKSLKILGDIGSILQLIGMYYVVLGLVVNSQVFPLNLVIGSVPVGTVAIVLVGVGFLMSFIFSNYEGNLFKSILSSMTNIVSMLLGVVNVFSDIVSYIRLWAVGLAGAAISATVNDLAGPFLGNLAFVLVAVLLLFVGHGLNMILNVLSVIVHGIRLNTLEFSSHLDMSWSGHKFKPFKE